MKCHLVLLLVSMMASVNTCEFGNDAIQSLYDRFEIFRKTKAFDPTNSDIPLTQYSYYETDGTKRLAVKINGDYMVEYYKNNAANEIETKNGQYDVKDSVTLNYKRDENGEFTFEDWSNGKKFGSSLRSIDAELPNNFQEDYKKVLLDLNTMRQKMFDYQKSLSKEDFERVQLFDFSPFSRGGFYAQYIENGGGSLSVSSEWKDGKETISGRMSCNYKDQKYKVVDGKVAVDGEPFNPVYN